MWSSLHLHPKVRKGLGWTITILSILTMGQLIGEFTDPSATTRPVITQSQRVEDGTPVPYLLNPPSSWVLDFTTPSSTSTSTTTSIPKPLPLPSTTTTSTIGQLIPSQPRTGYRWDSGADCESGERVKRSDGSIHILPGTADWHLNTGNGYYGGLQFSLSTWRSAGGTGLPHQASREEQITRAERLVDELGASVQSQWPRCYKYL